MTREEYLVYRTNRTPEPLYVFYAENYNTEKYKTFLNQAEFFMFIQMWVNEKQIYIEEIYHKVIHYYDVKFNIVTITNIKTGQIIKFI